MMGPIELGVHFHETFRTPLVGSGLDNISPPAVPHYRHGRLPRAGADTRLPTKRNRSPELFRVERETVLPARARISRVAHRDRRIQVPPRDDFGEVQKR